MTDQGCFACFAACWQIAKYVIWRHKGCAPTSPYSSTSSVSLCLSVCRLSLLFFPSLAHFSPFFLPSFLLPFVFSLSPLSLYMPFYFPFLLYFLHFSHKRGLVFSHSDNQRGHPSEFAHKNLKPKRESTICIMCRNYWKTNKQTNCQIRSEELRTLVEKARIRRREWLHPQLECTFELAIWNSLNFILYIH